jgi:GT2 family glycosyltransferase
MGPTVSVVVPTFRRERQLVRAIGSVVDQAEVDLIEVVVVDDSPEGSARDAVGAIGDRRVVYVPSETPGRRRPGLARNQGARVARGELLHFLDDDDELAEGSLATLSQALTEHPHAAFACGTVVPFGRDREALRREERYFTRATRALQSTRGRRLLASRLLFGDSPLPTSVALNRRSSFETLGGFDGEVPVCEDADLYLRAARRFGFVFVNRPVLHYHTGAPSIMSDLRSAARRQSELAHSYARIHEKYRQSYGDLEYYGLKAVAVAGRLARRLRPQSP